MSQNDSLILNEDIVKLRWMGCNSNESFFEHTQIYCNLELNEMPLMSHVILGLNLVMGFEN